MKKDLKNIEVKNITTNEIIDLKTISKYLDLKNTETLKKYKFNYMSQNDFNTYIKVIDIKLFRKLYFACPICNKPYRHFSMNFNIFQNHFKKAEEYLSVKQLSFCCVKLMKMEYKKFENSLQTFSELAVVFQNCKIKGKSEWIIKAENEIESLRNLNIINTCFKNKKDEAFYLLNEKLPLNKNKRYRK